MSHHEVEENQTDEIKKDGQPTQWQIRPRGLHIVWGNDSRYWQLIETNGKPPYAELKQVCWLEITGSLKNVEAGKKYAIQFSVSMKQDAFGWNGCPLFMMAKVGKKGRYTWKKINILDDPAKKPESDSEFLIPRDQPLEITVSTDQDKTIFFGLYEVWSGKWKGGLRIYKAIITEK